MCQIYWHCLDMSGPDEAFLEEALTALLAALRRPPIEVTTVFERLPGPLAPAVSVELQQEASFHDVSIGVAEAFADFAESPCRLPGLIVYCSEDSAVAQAAQAGESTAEWGAACGCLAAVWKPDHPGLVWHEALHLLGAQDCYCRGCFASPTCERPNCVMQFVPPADVAGGRPFLCQKNIALLRYLDRARITKGKVRAS